MSRLRAGSVIGLLGSVMVLGPACDGDGTGLGRTGEIAIQVSGFPPGFGPPFAGLAVGFGDETRVFTLYHPVPRLAIKDLAPGTYTVRLEGLPVGVPADCEMTGLAEHQVTVRAGSVAPVVFTLACTWGRLEIATTTTGADPDVDGYTVQVSGGCYDYYDYACAGVDIPAPSNGTVIGTISASMFTATYEARVLGVADNCLAPDAISFSYPQQATISFTITCT